MPWILEDIHRHVVGPWSTVALALASIFAGLIVGVARERKDKVAGLKTLTLVSLGSATFTMLDAVLAGGAASGRVAAQVVSGVGFLGAGAIMRGPLGIQGLTSAATIWAVAATGMVIGAGYAAAGLALSLAILVVLWAGSVLEMRYLGPCVIARANLIFDVAGGKTQVLIEEILDSYQIPEDGRRFETETDGTARGQLTFCKRHKHHREFLKRLAAIPEVRRIER